MQASCFCTKTDFSYYITSQRAFFVFNVLIIPNFWLKKHNTIFLWFERSVRKVSTYFRCRMIPCNWKQKLELVCLPTDVVPTTKTRLVYHNKKFLFLIVISKNALSDRIQNSIHELPMYDNQILMISSIKFYLPIFILMSYCICSKVMCISN